MAYRFKHGDRPLEDYTIQRGVGRGGFGEVYYAISDGGREVALKYLRENADVELRGVSACMNLKSPHLVMIFDVKKSAEGEYFIIMEYVSGPSLRDLMIAEPSGLGPQKAAFFVREIGKGLSYLHDRGIVHRDLKPGNIFYEDGYVKIGDYGLSKFISVSRHSAQTTSVGTVHYMAPEVGSGSYTRSIDIYALGVILYEMLLGRVPFEGSSMGEVLMKHLTAQPEVDALAHPFAQVIRKALAKDPNDRYQTVDEMVDALLDVDDVKQSVAGFNPGSLSAATRRAAGDLADSPIPSPNPVRPMPAPPPRQPVAPPGEWPEHRRPEVLTGRLNEQFDRVNRKVEKKLRKLGGRPVPPGPPVPVGLPAGPPAALRGPVARTDRWRRVLLAGVMTLGVATGVGLLVGTMRWEDDGAVAGVSTFLLVAAISVGVLFSRWLLAIKIASASAGWIQRLVVVGCCLPLMAVAAAPALGEGGDEGAMALLALVLAVVASRWDERVRQGAEGELSVRPALGLGTFALVLAFVFQAEEFALMAGGTAAAAVLSVQALAAGWPIGVSRALTARPVAAPSMATQAWAMPPTAPSMGTPAWGAPLAEPVGAGPIPMGIRVDARLRGVSRASSVPLPPMRSTFARGFWSLVAFVLAGGFIATFVLPLATDFTRVDYNHVILPNGTVRLDEIRGPDYGTYFGLISGCVAHLSFLIFALRKTTQRKRPGFWQETLRPFLIAASMTGIGVCITVLATPGYALATPDRPVADEAFAVTIVALVYSSVMLLVLLILRGRRARPSYLAGEPSAEC